MAIILVLGTIFFIFYRSVCKKINSGKLYFFFLFCFLLPVVSVDLSKVYIHEVNPINMIIFGLCLCIGFLPWLAFEKWNRGLIIEVPDRSLNILKFLFIILILGSLYSIIYLLPYAVVSFALGADVVRSMLYSGEAILPHSPLTTIATFFAGCHIYAILFFYIACLTAKLKRYRFWLLISSLSYMVSCVAITARDGAIILPCFYIVFYVIFSPSLRRETKSGVYRILRLVLLTTAVFLIIFSISRFYDEDGFESFYGGTVGYINQQPYVFDDIVEKHYDFWGFEVRFPLINRIIGVKEHEVNRRDNYYEWSFGTMYGDMYESFGWPGVFIYLMIFVNYYYWGIRYLERKKNMFAVLLLFSVYLYIAVTGMFYLRAGGAVTQNLFMIVLSILPFFTKRYLSIRRDYV